MAEIPKEQPKKTGRPKIPIDYDTVEKLATMMCTQEEIATFFGCHVRTLQRDKDFCRHYKKGQEGGKMSLRRIQWKHAEKNPSMAMFLGKVYLGQRENKQVDEGTNDMPEMKITVVDNTELEKALYDADK